VGEKGLRGSAPTRIDDKGRLKVPTTFRGVIQDRHGADVFVTSVNGDCVRIYPLPVWLEIEERLSKAPSVHPSHQKFLTRVSYWGQEAELDGQGRIVIPQKLRESASIRGEVRVFGRINHLEVWNEEQFAAKLASEPWTDEDALALAAFGI
jgi:MraZ protein